MKIGLFYGSTTCYTEMAAEKIKSKLDELFGLDMVDMYNIKDVGLAKVSDYQWLIFGISTWDFGELQEDWEAQWQDVENLELSGKTLALFGLGDQEGYAEWFQDALGMLHDLCLQQGAAPIGYWPNSSDYEFEGSKALTEDKSHFVGLALDDETQYDQSEQRIEDWCQQLLTELE